jgi:hypothetical protein
LNIRNILPPRGKNPPLSFVGKNMKKRKTKANFEKIGKKKENRESKRVK